MSVLRSGPGRAGRRCGGAAHRVDLGGREAIVAGVPAAQALQRLDVERVVAAGSVGDDAVGHAVEAVARRHHGAGHELLLSGAEGAAGNVVRQPQQVVPSVDQEQVLVRRVVGDDTVVVVAVALRRDQRLVTALGPAGEVLVAGRDPVVGADQELCGVAGAFDALAGIVGERLGVQSERSSRVGTDGVARVAPEGGVVALQRRGRRGRPGGAGDVAQPGDHRSVEPAAAELHRAPDQLVGRFTWKLIGGAVGSKLRT